MPSNATRLPVVPEGVPEALMRRGSQIATLEECGYTYAWKFADVVGVAAAVLFLPEADAADAAVHVPSEDFWCGCRTGRVEAKKTNLGPRHSVSAGFRSVVKVCPQQL